MAATAFRPESFESQDGGIMTGVEIPRTRKRKTRAIPKDVPSDKAGAGSIHPVDERVREAEEIVSIIKDAAEIDAEEAVSMAEQIETAEMQA